MIIVASLLESRNISVLPSVEAKNFHNIAYIGLVGKKLSLNVFETNF